MKVKFSSADEFLIYLSRTDSKFKKRLYSTQKVEFLNLEFESYELFFDFLEKYSIVEIIFKPVIITQKTGNGNEIFKEYSHHLEYIILDTKILNSLLLDKTTIYQSSQNKLLTIKEVGSILGLTKPSIYKLFKDGKLSYYEILSQKKVQLSELNEFLNQNRKRE